jgi:hypothetical protein
MMRISVALPSFLTAAGGQYAFLAVYASALCLGLPLLLMLCKRLPAVDSVSTGKATSTDLLKPTFGCRRQSYRRRVLLDC